MSLDFFRDVGEMTLLRFLIPLFAFVTCSSPLPRTAAPGTVTLSPFAPLLPSPPDGV